MEKNTKGRESRFLYRAGEIVTFIAASFFSRNLGAGNTIHHLIK
jgi:hypothetical protein